VLRHWGSLVGLGVFSLASAAAALSSTVETLIATRINVPVAWPSWRCPR
jgi:hypothetical protein